MSLLPTQGYYYTITGDVQQGDNKSNQVSTSYPNQEESRFLMGEPLDIIDIGETTWGPITTGSMSPYPDMIGNNIRPATIGKGNATPAAHND